MNKCVHQPVYILVVQQPSDAQDDGATAFVRLSRLYFRYLNTVWYDNNPIGSRWKVFSNPCSLRPGYADDRDRAAEDVRSCSPIRQVKQPSQRAMTNAMIVRREYH